MNGSSTAPNGGLEVGPDKATVADASERPAVTPGVGGRGAWAPTPLGWGVWAAAAITLASWGSVYSAIKVGLASFSPTELAFLRFLVGAALLSAYARVRGVAWPGPRHMPRLAAIGAIGFALYPVLLNAGQKEVDPGTASLVVNLTPAISALLAALFLRERLGGTRVAGVLLSLSGVAAIVVSAGGGPDLQPRPALLVLVLAAVCHALHFVLQKGPLRVLHALQVTLVTMWAGTACLLPFATGSFAALAQAPLGALAAVAYLGVLPTAAAYVLWAFVLRNMAATAATNLLSLVPPIAIACGALLLGELPAAGTLLGGAVIVAGVLLVQRRPPPLPAQERSP